MGSAKYPIQRTFYITRKLSEAINKMHKETGITKGQICREALAEYIWGVENKNDAHNDPEDNLAKYAHETWSKWMKYLFENCTLNDDGTVTIPKWAVERWQRQMNTSFRELPSAERHSDYEEAEKMLEIVSYRVR